MHNDAHHSANPARIPAQGDDILVNANQFLHRFDYPQARLMVVRTFEKPSGERYRQVNYEPWKGL